MFNEYTRSFPNNANFLYRYFIPKSPLEIFEIKSYNKIPYTHINAKLPINVELIEKDYPDLADYLEDLRGNFKISLKFKTKTGHTIGNAIINSTESIDFEAYTRSGKIIPFDSNGTPIFNEEFSGSSMKNYKLNVEIGIELKQYGLKGNVKLLCNGEYNKNPLKTTMHGNIIDIESSISGYLLGFIPPGFIDIMIPGNIEQLMSDYNHVILNANDGEGSFGVFKCDTRKPDDVIFSFNSSSEFMDCFLVRLGMRMLLMRFRADEDTREQMADFLKKIIMTFLKDINAIDNNLVLDAKSELYNKNDVSMN